MTTVNSSSDSAAGASAPGPRRLITATAHVFVAVTGPEVSTPENVTGVALILAVTNKGTSINIRPHIFAPAEFEGAEGVSLWKPPVADELTAVASQVYLVGSGAAADADAKGYPDIKLPPRWRAALIGAGVGAGDYTLSMVWLIT